MKTKYSTLVVIFGICLSAWAQPVLEKINPGWVYEVGQSEFMYVHPDLENGKVDIHHANHSLYKSIALPNNTFKVGYFSRGLFDCDSTAIEFIALTRIYDSIQNFSIDNLSIKIIREDGSVYWQKDSAALYANFVWDNARHPIFKTSLGAKMYVYTTDNKRPNELYALCGSYFPTTGNVESKVLGGMNAFPNPMKDYLEINYELPAGVQSATLLVSDVSGHTLKEYTVNQNFDSLLFDTSDIPSGTYFYTIITSKGTDTKKVIKIE